MQAKRKYRDREEVEVAVLDALVDRREEGMTVFEIRSHVNASIDEIETALGQLKNDDLICVDKSERRTLIRPHERVIPEPGEDAYEGSLVDRIRRKLPL
jgi:predicted transcriptional regulator